MNSWLSKVIFNLIPGILTLVFASWLIFGMEGIRIALITILVFSGLINVTIGLIALADRKFNKEKKKYETE